MEGGHLRLVSFPHTSISWAKAFFSCMFKPILNPCHVVIFETITKVWWVLVGVHENESMVEQGYSPIKQPIWYMILSRYCFEPFFFGFFLLLWGWGQKVKRGHWKHWWGGGRMKPWLIFMSSLTKMLPESWFERMGAGIDSCLFGGKFMTHLTFPTNCYFNLGRRQAHRVLLQSVTSSC